MSHDQQARALQLYQAGVPVLQIIGQIGISTSTLYRWLGPARDRYRTRPAPPRLKPGQIKQALSLYHKPRTLRQVAEAFGLRPEQMRELLAQHTTLRPYTRPDTGAEHQQIRDLLARGLTPRQVAERTGFSLGHVYRVAPADRAGRALKCYRRIVEHHQGHPHDTIPQTARACGVTVAQVRRALKKAGLHGHNPRVLDTEKLARAQKLYDTPMCMRRVAQTLGCSEHWLQKYLTTRSRSDAAKAAWRRRQQDG